MSSYYENSVVSHDISKKRRCNRQTSSENWAETLSQDVTKAPMANCRSASAITQRTCCRCQVYTEEVVGPLVGGFVEHLNQSFQLRHKLHPAALLFHTDSMLAIFDQKRHYGSRISGNIPISRRTRGTRYRGICLPEHDIIQVPKPSYEYVLQRTRYQC